MKFYFQLKSNSTDRIGQHYYETAWTDTCQTKKEVKERYGSKTSRGNQVLWVLTEEQFILRYGADKAAKIKKYWNA